MLWTCTAEPYHAQSIIWLHGVELVGWPEHISYDTPTSSSIRRKDLRELVEGVEAGTIYFRKLSPAEKQAEAQRHDSCVGTQELMAGRIDHIGRRPLRPVETRSKKLRKLGIKTSETVPPEYWSD